MSTLIFIKQNTRNTQCPAHTADSERKSFGSAGKRRRKIKLTGQAISAIPTPTPSSYPFLLPSPPAPRLAQPSKYLYILGGTTKGNMWSKTPKDMAGIFDFVYIWHFSYFCFVALFSLRLGFSSSGGRMTKGKNKSVAYIMERGVQKRGHSVVMNYHWLAKPIE